MTKIILFVFLLFDCLCFTPVRSQSSDQATLQFNTKKYDLGKISQTKVHTLKYEYTNTGTKPLVITKVDVSCGCVKAEWPKRPLPPNGSDCITVQFDPQTKFGYTLLSIYVKSNAENRLEIIRIQANIVKK